MKRSYGRWLLLIPLVVLVLAGACLFQFFNVKYIVYSGLYTYTTSDDNETYLIRWPGLYMVPFTSSLAINELRLHLVPEAADLFSAEGNTVMSDCMKRYHGHFDLDYSLKVEGDQIIVTYTGHGKLEDGSIETIDEVKAYPFFPFEDRSAGQWIPPGYPWEEETEPLFQDPSQVIDPPYS